MSDDKRRGNGERRFAARHAAEIRKLLIGIATLRDFRDRQAKHAAEGDQVRAEFYFGRVLVAVEALLDRSPRLDSRASCGGCNGTGRDHKSAPCPHCNGSGEYDFLTAAK